jgi:hypothetical protein
LFPYLPKGFVSKVLKGALSDDQTKLPIILPKLSFGPYNEIDATLDFLFEDILNAAGRGRQPSEVLRLEP